MPVTPRTRTLHVNGITVAATHWDSPRQAPKGTALLLHGGGQTRHSWHNTGQRLAADGWSTLAVDTRGHGESDWAPDGDYGPDTLVADLRAIVATLAEPPVLVGASLGGITALLAQGADPDLARGLVLVDVTPRVEPEGTAEVREFMRSGAEGFASLDEALAAVIAYNPQRKRPPRREGLRKNLRYRAGRWYWHWDPELLSPTPDPASSDSAAGTVHSHDGVEPEDDPYTARTHAAARAITVPTLLVRGSQSAIVSPAAAQELLELIPQAQRIDVPGAGHMVAGDDNDVFGDRLLDFLDASVLNPESNPRS